MATGTGTPGSNQNGVVPAPYGSPGEIVTVGGNLNINASIPVVDTSWRDTFVTTAYDLAVQKALRPALIFDQLARVKATKLSHVGASQRFSFVDDLSDATTPLLENIDIDSTALSAKSLTLSMREYGNAVTRTALVRGTSMIPFDPVAADRIAFNAAKSMDKLAQNALTAASVTYDDTSSVAITQIGTSASYLSSLLIQQGIVLMQDAHVQPFGGFGGNYVLVCSPVQAQHLKYDTSDTGWRGATMRNDGMGGNSVFNGEIGTYEGVRVIVSDNLADKSVAFLLGDECLAKVFSTAEGFGENPAPVVSPVTDKLRRFASLGWYHLVGYAAFRAEAIVRIKTSSAIKSA